MKFCFAASQRCSCWTRHRLDIALLRYLSTWVAMSFAHRLRTDGEREEDMASVPEVAELERDAEVLGF